MAETMPPASDNGDQARRLKRVGAYAKLLANYASDDAIIEAGEAAELMFVRGLAFCATSDADGYITDAQVTRYVGAGMRDAPKRAARLADVGLWERVDGGYVVRSWTKIHDTAETKGRRRKADRERKRTKHNDPPPPPDSGTRSERNPSGIQKEGAAESLSMNSAVTEQCTTVQDTTEHVDGSSRGDRRETLRVVPATDPPKKKPTSSCTRHPYGNPDDEDCHGCKRDNEQKARRAAQDAERDARETERARLECRRCDGVWVTDEEGNATGQKCNHGIRRSA